MFTGIVQQLGRVEVLKKDVHYAELIVKAEATAKDLKIGDSVAINGVCLTVKEIRGDCFHLDVMPQTLRRTELGDLVSGSRVNVEAAVRFNAPLGGHLVTGHVDGVGVILKKIPRGNAVTVEIGAPREVLRYLLPRGSIAVDGISLTVVEVLPASFTVSIIPHTMEVTTLGIKGVGRKVNLEADIIGKYVEKFSKKIDKPSYLENLFISEGKGNVLRND